MTLCIRGGAPSPCARGPLRHPVLGVRAPIFLRTRCAVFIAPEAGAALGGSIPILDWPGQGYLPTCFRKGREDSPTHGQEDPTPERAPVESSRGPLPAGIWGVPTAVAKTRHAGMAPPVCYH